MNPRIYLLPLGAFAIGTGNIVFVGVLEPLADDLGVSIATAGQLATTFALAFAVSAPLLVAVTARAPRRGVMVAALAVFAATNVGMALAPAFAWLIPLRIVAACAAGLYMPVAMGTAVTLAGPAQQGRAMAIVLFGLTAAFLGGIPLGTWIGSALGWRASFAFAAVLGGLALAAIAPTLPALPGTVTRGLRGIGVIARAPVAGNLAITALAFVAVFCVNAYIGPVLSRAAGLGGPGIAAMQVLLGLGSVLGVPLGGWIADRRPVLGGCPSNPSPTARAPQRRLSAIAQLAWEPPCSSHDRRNSLAVPRARDGAGYSDSLLGVVALLVAAIAVVQPLYSVLMLVPGWAGTGGAVATAGVAMVTASAALFALGPVQQDRLITAAPDEREIVLSLNGSALFLGQGIGAGLGGATAHAFGLAANGLAGGGVALAGLAAIGLAALRPRRGGATAAAGGGVDGVCGDRGGPLE